MGNVPFSVFGISIKAGRDGTDDLTAPKPMPCRRRHFQGGRYCRPLGTPIINAINRTIA